MMTDDEKRDYVVEITRKIEAAADRVYLKAYGRTYRPGKKVAPVSRAQKNGDSLGQVVHDFRALFSDKA